MSLFTEILGRWARKRASSTCAAIPAVDPRTGAEDLLREEFVMIFKHSTACPVSWAAHGQVTRFLRENPGAPVRLVRVIQERPLSRKIALATGVRHESPQIIALRRGEVVGSASHGQITSERLRQIVDAFGHELGRTG
jgi:bacillithiol system protein YtxJ